MNDSWRRRLTSASPLTEAKLGSKKVPKNLKDGNIRGETGVVCVTNGSRLSRMVTRIRTIHHEGHHTQLSVAGAGRQKQKNGKKCKQTGCEHTALLVTLLSKCWRALTGLLQGQKSEEPWRSLLARCPPTPTLHHTQV